MVEYKAMILLGFKEGAPRYQVAPPGSGFLNAHISGRSTWDANPFARYSRTELGNRTMSVIATGPRVTIKQLERLLVQSHSGPDNNEPWAGKGQDKRTPEQIIQDFSSKNSCVKLIRKS